MLGAYYSQWQGDTCPLRIMSITIHSGDSMVGSFITGDDVPPHPSHGSCEVGIGCLLQVMAG